jgi:hypothetical protein
MSIFFNFKGELKKLKLYFLSPFLILKKLINGLKNIIYFQLKFSLFFL